VFLKIITTGFKYVVYNAFILRQNRKCCFKLCSCTEMLKTSLLVNLLSQVIVIAQVEIHYIAKNALIPIIVEAQVRLHQF
jgi:hypothetical protein